MHNLSLGLFLLHDNASFVIEFMMTLICPGSASRDSRSGSTISISRAGYAIFAYFSRFSPSVNMSCVGAFPVNNSSSTIPKL